ncbi:FAD-dependent monooxygenase [Pseudonocardia xishanensis]|uniref:FAD-dependent monooxygenase n=1 Tax=Pseudonocardia xishanensis TaxID=630995 RepID=A0ABP8RFT4_9PSEU
MTHEHPSARHLPTEVPVLVVGGGPAGLVSSLALARYGVDSLLVERHPGTAHTPRAHIVNQRTVEIMRHLGIEDRFLAVATPQELMRNNLWVTSLAGREVVRSETWGTGARVAGNYRAASPCPMANCPQTVFEPMLVEAARDAGADIRFGVELESFTEDADGVTAVVRDRESGTEHVVRARYLIGADGARSRVLQQTGLTVEGPAGLAHAANVWFEADLAPYLAHRPGVLIWNVMPGPLPPLRLGTIICHKPFTEFVLVFMYDPDEDDLAELTTEDLVGRVRAAVGDDDLPVTIKGTAGWQVNAQVAPRYSRGRAFCMGDAVHRHPPTNGLGLNMSVADAYNLAWKLALVLDGRAGTSLLDTYSTERQPVGARGVGRAITSLGDMATVDAALGLVPGQSTDEGWTALAGLDAPGAEGRARRAALRDAISLTDHQFNAHGLELGYRYPEGALVPEPAGAPGTDNATDDLVYHPTTAPGARLPHARLELDGAALSTLDLVDGLEFALLTGPSGEGWIPAAAAVSAQTGVPIRVHVIGRTGAGPADPYREWESLREVDPDGCVLVRPDRHIAWRATHLEPEPAALLCDVVSRTLGLPEPARPGRRPVAAPA